MQARTLEERFREKVDVQGPDDCWPWTAATNEHGYGVMRPAGQRTGPTIKAHRVAARLAGMEIEGKKVRHSCDNPPCCNPRHLLPGTQAQNMADMHERGRAVLVGSSHPGSKLNETQVREIRELKGTMRQQDIAARFGVSRPTISRILSGQGWRTA